MKFSRFVITILISLLCLSPRIYAEVGGFEWKSYSNVEVSKGYLEQWVNDLNAGPEDIKGSIFDNTFYVWARANSEDDGGSWTVHHSSINNPLILELTSSFDVGSKVILGISKMSKEAQIWWLTWKKDPLKKD